MLFDTNILIDHFRGEEKASILLKRVEDRIIKGYISTITEAEVLASPKLTQKEIGKIVDFMSIFEKIEVNSLVAQKAADFRRKYKYSLMDMIIAASAFHKGIEIVTRNMKHFKSIKEIQLYNIDY